MSRDIRISPINDTARKLFWVVEYPVNRERAFRYLADAKEWAETHLAITGPWHHGQKRWVENGSSHFGHDGTYGPSYAGNISMDHGDDPPLRFRTPSGLSPTKVGPPTCQADIDRDDAYWEIMKRRHWRSPTGDTIQPPDRSSGGGDPHEEVDHEGSGAEQQGRALYTPDTATGQGGDEAEAGGDRRLRGGGQAAGDEAAGLHERVDLDLEMGEADFHYTRAVEHARDDDYEGAISSLLWSHNSVLRVLHGLVEDWRARMEER